LLVTMMQMQCWIWLIAEAAVDKVTYQQ